MPRPKGLPKSGGREKGSLNKRTILQAQEIAESGLTPLEYFLLVMRDEDNAVPIRLDAAKAAAPFVHPRLSSTSFVGEVQNVEKELSDYDFARRISFALYEAKHGTTTEGE